MGSGELVAGRTCGDCTVCCIVPVIDDAQIQKQAGIRCRHCSTGCAIYDARPEVCRAFHCGWRHLPELGDEWRPNRSGVFILLEAVAAAGVPPLLGVTLMLINEAFKVIHTPAFIGLVRDQALKGRPIFLALPGKPGIRPKRVRIRDSTLLKAAQEDVGWVETLLDQALRIIHAQPDQPYVPQYSGHDMGR